MELFFVDTPAEIEIAAAETLAAMPQFQDRGLSLLFVNAEWVLQQDDTEEPGHPEPIGRFFIVPTPEAVEARIAAEGRE